ncbi:MAG TPA: hypothetical protein VGR28_09240 [Candidatus Thermoplasmatota archaeon]|jgi:hypothetical protein|nr:hypothetical protein [Candidatus Thermoplasmatota archaeon]
MDWVEEFFEHLAWRNYRDAFPRERWLINRDRRRAGKAPLDPRVGPRRTF